jgi:putative transcriptional regulator
MALAIAVPMFGGQRRGHRAVNTKVYLRMDRGSARQKPPPNPLIDPLAHIKNPLRAFKRSRPGRERLMLAELEGRFARSGDGIVEFTPIDIQHIRGNFLATQRQFARMIGISYETLRNWETGRRRPHGPARALLRVMDANPFAVARALNWRLRDFKELPVDMLDE